MSLRTRVSIGVAATAAAVGALLVPATTAFAATPGLTVTANVPAPLLLQSGQTVTAVGSGYTPGATIALVECSSVVADGSGCDQTPANARIVTADGNGGFTVPDFVVTTGTKGSGTCGAGDTCFVAAANYANQTEAASDDFTFDNLQVSPRTNLTNGQEVNLVGGHFTASTQVYVSECTTLDPAKATTACDFNNVKVYNTDANGAFTGVFPVHTGVVGSDGSRCDPGDTCTLGATDNISDPAAGNIGGTLITFAPPPSVTPAVSAKSTRDGVAPGVKFAIKGKVTAGGKGINGLTVKLFRRNNAQDNWTKIGTKTTATNKAGVKGAYKFGGLTQKRPKQYQVRSVKGTVGGVLYTAARSKVVNVASVK